MSSWVQKTSLLHPPFRLVNTMHKLDDEKEIWRLTKLQRKKLLMKNSKPVYNKDNTLISDTLVKENIRNLEQCLKVSSTSGLIENVSDKTLDVAAKLFTYLNYCPPTILAFYKNLIKNGSVKNIISTLTR